MTNEQLVTALIQTLNNIEVKGGDNLDKLLGCIKAAEQLLSNLEEEEPNG